MEILLSVKINRKSDGAKYSLKNTNNKGAFKVQYYSVFFCH
jgi:hypothetical protein